jgi:hypothetical protein
VRQDDLVVPGESSELGGGVLAAATGAEDHAGVRVAGGDGVAQPCEDQPGAQVISHRMAHHPAGGDIDDGGRATLPRCGYR